MKSETWLARCAAELHHLAMTNPRGFAGDRPSDDWKLDTAGELIVAQRYRGLNPVQAARIFWRERASSPSRE